MKETMEEDITEDTKVKDFNRKKLKKLNYKIKNQMEFYFGDSNLARDKFLLDLIDRNPEGYVDLEVFKTFNKIKALTQDIKIIANAVSKSNLIELSSDGKMIRRKLPLVSRKDFDACTIYIERLPQNASREWLRDIFEKYGKIDHINIPYYKISHKIKGFAFIEFSSPESAEKACESYKSINVKEIDSSIDDKESDNETKEIKALGKKKKGLDVSPSKDSSLKKSHKNRRKSSSDLSPEKIHKSYSLKQNNDGENIIPDSKISENLTMQHKNSKKRKRQSSESDIESKKSKTLCNVSDNKNAINKIPKSEEEASCSKEVISKDLLQENECEIPLNESQKQLKCEDTTTIESEENIKIENQQIDDRNKIISKHSEKTQDELRNKNKDVKMHKRRRHKKHKNHESRLMLRVMSKAEWKSYRNKYLDLQRATMSYLKKVVLLEGQELISQENECPEPNFSPSKSNLEFQPGVILKIKLPEPIVDPFAIKEQIKLNIVAAYIDVSEGHDEIYVRCHTSSDAQSIVNEGKLDQLGSIEILKDAEESNYWKKIDDDRKAKYENPHKQKKRGREKIMTKATKLIEQKNKHIIYDE